MAKITLTFESNIADRTLTLEERVKKIMKKYLTGMDLDDLMFILDATDATKSEMDDVIKFYEKKNASFDIVDASAEEGGKWLGECAYGVYYGSENNVVHLKDGRVVVAKPGDCVTYNIVDYRWDGECWDRL